MRSRKVIGALLAALLIVGMIAAPPTARDNHPIPVSNPVDYVDTLIGTGHGGPAVGEINNFPGAAVPFGMVQYSPDTVGSYAGYAYGSDAVTGFSMTHASVGCPAFGDISMLPNTVRPGAQPWNLTEQIAHDHTETGVPGYYTVRFPQTGVTAELTATTRTGIGRFSYPANAPAVLHINPSRSLAGTAAATIRIGDDNTTVTGWAATGGFCNMNNAYRVFFAMTFSQPFTEYGTWDEDGTYPGARSAYSSYNTRSGGYVGFPPGSTVEVHTALSYVTVDGARANLAAESDADFDAARAAASAGWAEALARIRVAGSNRNDLTTFYTALYRTLLHPNTFNDVTGRYPGYDGYIHQISDGRTQYANFSDWDTYRGVAALHGLLFPDRAAEMAQSLVNAAEQIGSFPRWALANSATAEMSGDSVVPLIVNLYTFGGTDFDTDTALKHMVVAATLGGVGHRGYVERPGIIDYVKYGYLPSGSGPSASITLEWSVDDFAIGRFAAALGETAVADEFQTRAQNWQNLFNPTTGYISPRSAAGVFKAGPPVEPPPPGQFSQSGYDEGNAEQYVWWVPQNIAGLVSALGGRQAVAARLDRFTEHLNVGPEQPYLWIGNEVTFGVPWLYNFIGRPWQTQQLVDRIRAELFSPTPDGAPGNDDLGAMSAWYVWAALGLYPITPGTPTLTVHTPLFDFAEITVGAGKSLRITAPGASGPNRMRYLAGVSVDGEPIEQAALPDTVVDTGGEIGFTLSREPTEWASAESAAPPSYPAGARTVTVNVAPAALAIDRGRTAEVRLDAQRMSEDAGDEFTVTGAAQQPGISVTGGTARFAPDGSAWSTPVISVAPSVPAGRYPVVVSVTAGAAGRNTTTFTVVVAVR